MTDWTPEEYTAVSQWLKGSATDLRNAVAKFCNELAITARRSSCESLTIYPRRMDEAVNQAVEAKVYEGFLRRLEAEVNTHARRLARVSVEPTHEESE